MTVWKSICDAESKMESHIRRLIYLILDVVLFPIAWWMHRTSEFEDMPPILAFSLFRFGVHRPLKYSDPERIKRFKARIEYDTYRHRPPPTKDSN